MALPASFDELERDAEAAFEAYLTPNDPPLLPELPCAACGEAPSRGRPQGSKSGPQGPKADVVLQRVADAKEAKAFRTTLQWVYRRRGTNTDREQLGCCGHEFPDKSPCPHLIEKWKQPEGGFVFKTFSSGEHSVHAPVELVYQRTPDAARKGIAQAYIAQTNLLTDAGFPPAKILKNLVEFKADKNINDDLPELSQVQSQDQLRVAFFFCFLDSSVGITEHIKKTR